MIENLVFIIKTYLEKHDVLTAVEKDAVVKTVLAALPKS